MIVIHSGTIYNIEVLSKHSEFFDTYMNFNNLAENNSECCDLTHRGQPMKDVLDMIFNENIIRDFSYDRLKKMKPILDELLFSEGWKWKFDNENNVYSILHSAKEKEIEERRDRLIDEKKEKEGKICKYCSKINKWLKPKENLDWDNNRIYCSCDYERDDFGNRVDKRHWLEEYYSNDVNCIHGSSLFYT